MPEVRPIDANKLLKKCIEGDGSDKFTEGYNFAVREISAYITLAPTVEPEVRHGRWIFRDDDKHLIEEGILPANMWCSNCGNHHDNDDYGDDYCSTCGAKMDGGADNG